MTNSALQLLWGVESVLRRQLQAETDPAEGEDLYTTQTTTTTTEEASQSRGRTVLTILYLCVLGLCFVVPVFYYFRLHCFEENARRELELDFTTALEQSEMHREESRAARRKYIEERRARIVQLLGPVRMILKEENFPHLCDAHAPPQTGSFLNLDFESEMYSPVKSDNESATAASEDVFSPYTSDDEDADVEAGHIVANDSKEEEEDNDDESKPERGGVIETKCESEKQEDEEHSSSGEEEVSRKKDPQHNPYGDEDTFFIRIPVPGLPLGGSCLLDPTRMQRMDHRDREMRLAPGLCTICLSNYKVGSDMVWSSNEACDHHFHASCIEKWLMKQREGPLCPCCRRDFIVDPLDLLEEEENTNKSINGEGGNNNNNNANISPTMFSWDPATLDENSVFGPIIVAAPGGGAGHFAFDPTRLEEGLNAPVAAHEAEVDETATADSNQQQPKEDDNLDANEMGAATTATGSMPDSQEDAESAVRV